MSSAYINIMEQNLRVLQCLLMRLSRAKILLKAYIQVKKAIFKKKKKSIVTLGEGDYIYRNFVMPYAFPMKY